MNEYIMIGLGLLVILVVLYLLVKFSNKFRKRAYEMFLFAENNVIKGRKMEYVVNQLYDLLPAVMQILPKSFYKNLLQKMFDEVKDLLDDGRVNKSNKKESDN